MARGTISRLKLRLRVTRLMGIRQLVIASLVCLVLASCSYTGVKTEAEKEPASDIWSDAKRLKPLAADTGKQAAPQSRKTAPVEKTVKSVPKLPSEMAITESESESESATAKSATANTKTKSKAEPVLPPATVTHPEKEPPSKPDEIAKLTPPPEPELPLQFRLEQLPMPVSDTWTLVLETDATTGKSECGLVSREFLMQDGQGSAKVTLLAYADQLRINTNSNIDLSYEGDGIRFGAKPELFPLEALDRETNLVFRSSAGALYRQMRKAESMTLLLGFWPTWPITQVYPLQLDLKDFDSAWSALEQCRKKNCDEISNAGSDNEGKFPWDCDLNSIWRLSSHVS